MDIQPITAWAAVITAIGAIGGIIGGILTYKKSIKERRTEWLYRLFKDFYEDDQFKQIRAKLDSENIRILEDAIKKETNKKELTESEDKFLEAFVDYLNFFEFILYLQKTKALHEEEVKQLFAFYLNLLKNKSKIICEYILKPENGFELLGQYLENQKE